MIEPYLEAASLFQGLADPTRLDLLQRIAEGECCASELHTALGMSQPRVARHLKILVDAGLVVARRDGRFVRYVITREPVAGGVVQAALALLVARPAIGREAREPASTGPGGRVAHQGLQPAARLAQPGTVTEPTASTDEPPPRDVLEDFLL